MLRVEQRKCHRKGVHTVFGVGDQWPQKAVPAGHKGEDGQRHQRGLNERQNDLEENFVLGAAVHLRGLNVNIVDAFHKLADHKHAKRARHAVGTRHQPHTLLYHPAVDQALGILQRRIAARDRFADDGLNAVLRPNFKITLDHHALAQRKLTGQCALVFAVIPKADFAAQPANGRGGGKHHPCQLVRAHMRRAFRVAENKANDPFFGFARLF